MMKIVSGLVNKVETKTVAASAGSGGGAVVAGFVLYLVGVLVYGASATDQSGATAVGAVPAPVSAFTFFVLAVAGAAIGGYAAPHTSRTVTSPADTVGVDIPGHDDPADGSLVGDVAAPDPTPNGGGDDSLADDGPDNVDGSPA